MFDAKAECRYHLEERPSMIWRGPNTEYIKGTSFSMDTSPELFYDTVEGSSIRGLPMTAQVRTLLNDRYHNIIDNPLNKCSTVEKQLQ